MMSQFRGPLAVAAASLLVPLIATAVPSASSAPAEPAAPSTKAAPPAKAAPSTPAAPSPKAGPTEPPSAVPSVQEYDAATGPGWQPQRSTRVVVAPGDSELADEGKLLAQEMKRGFSSTGSGRAGDIELALAPGGAPESYTLTVRDGRVRVTGADEAGVFYGTRTVKQALRADGRLSEGVVRDKPAKPQRGLMLDTARKHYTAGWIEDTVREMGDLKLNQLVLHFSDDQGFRIASESHPEIVSEQHLTKAEVRRIVKLAQSRHIEVIPEIDSPGHLGAVMRAHPDLQLRDVNGAATPGAVDISNPASARIVDDLLNEYAGLFPGRHWHLGGDEYQALMKRDPEASYPQLARAAVSKYGSGARIQDLATGWLNDRAAALRPHGKRLKSWNDGLHAGGVVKADQDREVEYWTGKEIGARQPAEYLSEGRKLVNANDEYLYYVLGEPNTFTYPTGRRIYESWTPLVLRGTDPVPARYADQILGGRLAIWGDLPNAQTEAEVARGIHLPLRALAQKTWDADKPALDWEGFKALAGRTG
ncbi:glycoside hydrolase family 20 protein [Streptomyces sp. Wb2n-11]|uniref:beta-N-acetylhexosaminidase n=1 Tax=Streptomyces sp. Wb2n-11 TaxID=1030533 RepID=UPI0021003A66|nr:glycoside hydrolase family 20 protein [Streptomyces sp. Wb2n-11]